MCSGAIELRRRNRACVALAESKLPEPDPERPATSDSFATAKMHPVECDVVGLFGKTLRIGRAIATRPRIVQTSQQRANRSLVVNRDDCGYTIIFVCQCLTPQRRRLAKRVSVSFPGRPISNSVYLPPRGLFWAASCFRFGAHLSAYTAVPGRQAPTSELLPSFRPTSGTPAP